jgi:hypothetical protein
LSHERPSDVLGALPRRRPHRRSDKRPAATQVLEEDRERPVQRKRVTKPAATPAREPRAVRPRAPKPRKEQPLRQPAQPPGFPPTSPERESAPAQPAGRDILGTAAQAAAEIAEIGLSLSARALRNAVARLPRP